jgi:hypothetical protein
MMSVPKFDVFSGRDQNDGLWLEVAGELEVACSRMYELAAKQPGPYFVYSKEAREIVARVDTSKPQGKKGQSAGS